MYTRWCLCRTLKEIFFIDKPPPFIKNKLNTFIKSYEKFLKEQGNKGLELIQKNNIPKDVFAGGGTIPSFFNKIQIGEKIAYEEIFIPTVFKTLRICLFCGLKSNAASIIGNVFFMVVILYIS